VRILLVRLRLIGDVVFTTPIIRALKEQLDDVWIGYVVEPAAAPVLFGNPHLDEVIVAARPRGFARVLTDLALARRLRSLAPDLAIDLHGGPRSAWLTWASGAPRRIGYRVPGRSWMYTEVVDRPRDLRPRHSVLNQWDLVAAMDPRFGRAPDPATQPVEMVEDRTAAAALDARLAEWGLGPRETDTLVVVHVSAGNRFRQWPAEAFAALAASLVERDPTRRVVLTSGPSDGDATIRIVRAARERLPDAGARKRLVDAADLPLAELRVLLARSHLFIGGDSGPLHVAATTDVPIVALFGPTLPVRSRPWRDPAAVTECVDVGELPCRPCDQRVCAPGDFRCLTGLDPALVAAAAERALAGRSTGRVAAGAGAGRTSRVRVDPMVPSR
jgi:lipopolysaccharide heptosyltransferase II